MANSGYGLLQNIHQRDEAIEFSKFGQRIFNLIECSSKIYVAGLSGMILSSGLELALACHYRIIFDLPTTKLSMPQIILGMCPYLGGIERLLKLCGLDITVQMVLTGKDIYANQALNLNLVDEIIKPIDADNYQSFIDICKNICLNFAMRKKKVASQHKLSMANSLSVRSKSFKEQLLNRSLKFPIFRNLIFQNFESNLIARTNKYGNFLTIHQKVCELIKHSVKYIHNHEILAHLCSHTFADLIIEPGCKSLIHIFQGQNFLKFNMSQELENCKKMYANHGRNSRLLSKNCQKILCQNTQFTFNKVAIIGSGKTGREIGQISALKGFYVDMYDRNERHLEICENEMEITLAIQAQNHHYKKFNLIAGGAAIAKKSLSTSGSNKIPASLQNSTQSSLPLERNNSYINLGHSLKERTYTSSDHLVNYHLILENEPFHLYSDYIIISIYDEFRANTQIIKYLEHDPNYSPNMIIAINTSCQSISKLAKISKNPESIIGLTYITPIRKKKILEIIPSEKTSQLTIDKTRWLATMQGKLSIVVKDCPGFFITRCITPVILEVLLLLQEGIKIEVIDSTISNWGETFGIFSTLDYEGILYVHKMVKYVSNFYKNRKKNPMTGGNLDILNDMITTRLLGKFEGEGFYKYDKNGKIIKVSEIVLKIINEYKISYKKIHPNILANLHSQENIKGVILRGKFLGTREKLLVYYRNKPEKNSKANLSG